MKYEERFVVINKKFIISSKFIEALTEFEKELPSNKYYVCNQDEPYAGEVYNIIEKGEDVKLENYGTRLSLGLTPEFILLEKRNEDLLSAIGSESPTSKDILLPWMNEFRRNLQRLDEIRYRPLNIEKIKGETK